MASGTFAAPAPALGTPASSLPFPAATLGLRLWNKAWGAWPKRLTAWFALSLMPLLGQNAMEPGPFPTREMFPLYLSTLVYQPVDPAPLEAGHFRISVDHTRANTFEFSDVFKDHPPGLPGQRSAVTRERALEIAAAYPALPVLFSLTRRWSVRPCGCDMA